MVYGYSHFTAEYLGFTTYQPAYLSQEASGKNLLTGANFASAASGFYDPTALLYVCKIVNTDISVICISIDNYVSITFTVLLYLSWSN